MQMAEKMEMTFIETWIDENINETYTYSYTTQNGEAVAAESIDRRTIAVFSKEDPSLRLYWGEEPEVHGLAYSGSRETGR